MTDNSLEYLHSLNTRRFRCCCGRVHVKKGALVAGALELFIALAVMLILVAIYIHYNIEINKQVLKDAVNATTTPGDTVLTTTTAAEQQYRFQAERLSPYIFGAGILLGLAYILGILFMMLGVRRKRAKFLVPHLIVQLLAVLFLATTVVLSIMVLVAIKGGPERSKQAERAEAAAAVILVASAIMLAFEIWFLNIVYKCYRYLRARRAHLDVFRFTKKSAVPAVVLQGHPGLKTAFSPSVPMLPWIDGTDE
uniref:Uncharacterized protein n=1 Tax=Romanomermis culicivorax TaxID=13658 RepID=A0A915LAL7_ROMCU